jgi:peptidoglycan hydrolase-like protein with peptidoglycan-binding domain
MKKIILSAVILVSSAALANAMLPNAYNVDGSSLGVPQSGVASLSSIVQGQDLNNKNIVGTGLLANNNAVSVKTVDYSALSYGNRGESVKELQRHLNSKGAKLPVTGYFGKMTRTAVSQFMK